MMLITLLISFFINVFLLWFIYRLIIRQSEMTVMFEDIKYRMEFFKNHISNIYELPMFYGEPTIQSLITHSKELLGAFNEFEKDILILSSKDSEEEENDL